MYVNKRLHFRRVDNSDLSSSNQFVAGLALCSLGNVASTEMSRDLGPEVLKLLSNSSSYIRKKAALTSIRVLTRVCRTYMRPGGD